MAGLMVSIIRHAEKPGEEWPGPGLTETGDPDDEALVVRGWQRAGAWAALFGAGVGGPDYPRPARIYAADPDGDEGHEPSQRPFETAKPIADRLGLTVITKWSQGQEAELAAEIAGLTGAVLVCWEHKRVFSGLLPGLLGQQPPAGVPAGWKKERFDVVLRLDRAGAGQPWSFRQLLPRLLSGDSDAPL